MSLLNCALKIKHLKNIRFLNCKSVQLTSVLSIHNSEIYYDSNLKIKMPSLSPTMTEGMIVKWLKKEGDVISPGDTLCEIQTDKAVVGFETEEEGVLHKILIPEDTKNVKLGEVIAEMIIEGEVAEISTPSTDTVKSEAKQHVPVRPTSARSADSEQMPKLCGPSVRNLLLEYGIKYSLIKATGPQNNVLKGDVLKYIKSYKLKKPQAEAKAQVSSDPDITFVERRSFVDVPHTSDRQTIARQLVESKTKIPHAYMSIESNVNNVLCYINLMKAEGVSLSINDFLIKCSAEALDRVKEINVVEINNQVQKLHSIDISFTVATDNGLFSPILKNANKLNIQQISEQVEALTQKAMASKLEGQDSEGGSFTISNLGVFGISEFSDVIIPTQAAILAAGMPKLVLQEKDKPFINKMIVTLSFNNRLVDQNNAARFLQCFKHLIEDPFSIVV